MTIGAPRPAPRQIQKACIIEVVSEVEGMMASNGEAVGKLERLQYHLEGFIENLRTVGVIAGDFQQNGQNNFNEKL